MTCCNFPHEMAAAIGKNVVWYTGNSTVALSTDYGHTFRMFDPATLLSDFGLPFCCDQQVSYSAKYNLFVWEMQYWCAPGTSNPATANCNEDGTGANRIRIAYTSPESLKAHEGDPGDAWFFFDITPQDFGMPADAWFDRSSLSVNDYNVNWSVDILPSNSGVRSMLAQIPLSELTPLPHKIDIWHQFDSTQRLEVAQGPGSITYYAGTDSLSRERIYSWEPYTSVAFIHNVDHATVPNCDIEVDGTDGLDWDDRFGIFPGRVESATVSGNTLYVAQGTGRAYGQGTGKHLCDTTSPGFKAPAIDISQYDVNTWTMSADYFIDGNGIALVWPALQTDGAGDVGITFHAAADGDNPRPVAGFLTPDLQVGYAEPAGMPYDTGDYYSLRPGRTPESFVMTGETVQNDNGTTELHWDYIEYGHGPAPYVARPNVSILSPKDQANVNQGDAVTYTGSAYDPVDGTLPNAAVVWREDGNFIGNGYQVSHVETATGVHTITLTATNADGKPATAKITVNVHPPAPPGSPTVSITSPADSSHFCAGNQDDRGFWSATVQFQATASDANNPLDPLTYSRVDRIDGGQATQVSTSLSPALDLYYFTGDSHTIHDLTLPATNSDGKSTTAYIRITIGWPCIS